MADKRKAITNLTLWGYAASIAAFYGFVYLRTRGTGARPMVRSPREHDAQWPRVSIIVPARDEERNIRACVESLLAQQYPNFEVLVVDDASTDRTPEILASLARAHPLGERLRVLRVSSLPPGWAGKPHALQVGSEAATGDWLLFTDADTRHEPQALASAVAAAQAEGVDLLTLGTMQELPDFWGRVLMPMAYMGISMEYPPSQVNRPESPIAIANGQYLLIKRATFQQLGGYATEHMRATVVDDRDLARAVKRAGGRMRMLDGRDLVRTRMYHSLAEHWRGWGKNAYAGSRGGPFFFALMLAGLPLVTVVPFVLAAGGAVTRHWRAALAGAVASAAAITYRGWLNRDLGVPWRYVWTQPLAGAVFTGILARGLWRGLTGRGVEWKGRAYVVRQE
ncbi:MAG: glycosyltransferase [Ktedonobacterales bacterium]